MKNIIFLLLLVSSFVYAGEPVNCGPVKTIKKLYATVNTVKAGDWNDPTVWSSGKVPSALDEITTSHDLTVNNKNIIHQGIWHRRQGKLTFLNVNEANYVGSGMDPISSDPGVWIMGDGQLDWIGDQKTSWTNLTGSAFKGENSITVKSTAGWRVGDIIVVVPTDKPQNQHNWNDATNKSEDVFGLKFERRTISNISGNTLLLNTPLAYDHLSVTSIAKTWTAEVMNLSRSIVTEGTANGRVHIFIRSNKPQTIKYTEGRFLGPRTPGNRSGTLVSGRYGLHFHHCMEGSAGSVVEGNSFHDIGNRVYVPHFSNGILFKNNVGFAAMEKFYWWDFQHQSHRITYDGNIAALTVNNGVHYDIGGFELNQGDGNSAINNVSVYTHFEDIHGQGGFIWNADSEGVWDFRKNLSHSNWSGMFIWQNTSHNHHVIGHEWYNNEVAVLQGAYVNSYLYADCIVYNSYFKVKAAPGNTSPMFERMIFDGGNQIDYLVETFTSPAKGGPNIFVNCTFRNFKKAAFLMNTFNVADAFNVNKVVDIVNPDYSGQLTAFSPQSVYGSSFRVQPKSGQPFQVTQSGTTNISPFAPLFYGTGTGASAKYYNGAAFNQLAFERVDPMIKFQQWSFDKAASPTEVDYRIKSGGPYSVIWEFEIETQYPGINTYAVESWGGVKLSIDNKLLLDRWTEFNDRVIRDAASIQMDAGKKYKIRIEHFDAGGGRGFMLYQKVNNQYFNVPMSQMYPIGSTPPPPPPTNRPPVVDAGQNIIIYKPDSIYKVEGKASDPDTNLVDVKWTVGNSNVLLTQNLSDAAHVMVKTKTEGVYTLTLTAIDKMGLSASDQMTFSVIDTTKKPPPPPATVKANAGPDQTITGTITTLDGSASTGSIRAVNWYRVGSTLPWNPGDQNNLTTVVNQLVKGVYNFRLKLTGTDGTISSDTVRVVVGSGAVFSNKGKTDSVTCPSGKVLKHTVPAGKYTAATQAAADALEIQELNTELSKCPTVVGTFTVASLGWVITVYSDKTVLIK